MGRWGCWLLATCVYVVPVAWVLLADVSLILPQHEFVGYRFYGSLAILWGQPETVYVVQGYPMAVVQHLIVWLLVEWLGHDPTSVVTLDLFIRSTLLACYGLGTLLLGWVWQARRYWWTDRLLLTAALVLPWYGWPVQPLWLSPDYWPWSAVYAVASAAIAVWLTRRGARPGWRTVLLCGMWLGLGVSHKLLLGAVGVLPLLCAGLRTRWLPLAPVAAGLTVVTVVWAFALGNLEVTVRVLADLAALPARSDNGFTASQLGVLAYPFVWVTFVTAVWLLALGVWRQRRWLLIWTGGLFAILLLASFQRPSMTTYVDVALYLAALGSLGAAGVCRCRWRWTLAPLLLVPLLVWWAGSWRILTLPTAVVWNGSTQAVAEAQAYVRHLDRPVTVWMPSWSPSHYPYTVEQIALYHGRLALGPDGNDGVVMRRLFPRTRLEFRPDATSREAVWQAARRGEVVVWGEQDGQPPLETSEGWVLRPLRRATVREFRHIGLGARRIVVAVRAE